MKALGVTKETVHEIGIYKRDFPEFRVGDLIIVHVRIKEGDKERVQQFQGNVIALHHLGASSSFTVRKTGAHGIAVERIFPFYSPLIKEITFLKSGKIRRAKLYYLRRKIGKSARVEEKIYTREQKEQRLADNNQ